ncbi:adenosylcobinamide-GDP ribazoletransferase [Chelatococcus sp. GCM10030263]|uniref:adenosylcobinamide-GDP ribazoletransferase n=1 Tax=Chelatococcus sp. GCM10030263 TaxID=3273387 RepID=UPI00360FBFCA
MTEPGVKTMEHEDGTSGGKGASGAKAARPLARLMADTAACLGFYSRLPLPRGMADGAAPRFATSVRALPIAGAIIGAVGALVMAAALELGLGTLPAAILAVAALLAATGALHEDGLADTADGLFGGTTPERRLAIMRDSRIGAFGAAALCLGLFLRVALIAEIAGRGGMAGVAMAIVAAAAASRTAGLLPLVRLTPARSDGAAMSVGRPEPAALRFATLLALLIAAVAGIIGDLALTAIVTGCLAAVVGAWGITVIARRKIGGHTGDIAGAAQQIAEIAFLLGLLAASAQVSP